MKRIFSLIVIIVLVLSLMACDSKEDNNSELVVGYDIGDLAYNIEVENIDGEVVKLSDFKGKKVYLLAWTST